MCQRPLRAGPLILPNFWSPWRLALSCGPICSLTTSLPWAFRSASPSPSSPGLTPDGATDAGGDRALGECECGWVGRPFGTDQRFYPQL